MKVVMAPQPTTTPDVMPPRFLRHDPLAAGRGFRDAAGVVHWAPGSLDGSDIHVLHGQDGLWYWSAVADEG